MKPRSGCTIITLSGLSPTSNSSIC
jgi:hypothetical protein